MTVSSTTSRNNYTGSGTVGPFSFTFRIQQAADLLVVTQTAAGVQTTLAYLTDYTISGVGVRTGGSVTLTAVLAAGTTISLIRSPALTQLTNLRNQGSYRPSDIEDALDRGVMIDQEQQDALSRTLTAPSSDTGSISMAVPSATLRANKFLAFDGTGAPTAISVAINTGVSTVSTFMASVINQTTAVLALAALGFSAFFRTLISATTATALRALFFGRPRVSLLDYGAKGDGVTDDTANINLALAGAAALGAELWVPNLTYSVTPATAVTDASGLSVLAAFTMLSNLHIEAELGATFKVANGVSSNASPKSMYMFFSNAGALLSNISIRRLSMDMNGANNLINGLLYNQSQIAFSGESGGVQAGANDVLIEECQFLNSPGTNALILAQQKTAGKVLGARWTIRRNTFSGNGFTSTDHSTVYGWADDVTFEDNTMVGPVDFLQAGVAYEIHGARCQFTENRISKYRQGMWIGLNSTTPCTDHRITNNYLSLRGVGVDFDADATGVDGIANVLINSNLFEFDDVAFAPGLKVAVQVSPGASGKAFGVIGVTVSNNLVRKNGTTVGCALGVVNADSLSAGHKHDKIVYRGNTLIGGVYGVALYTNATNGIGAVSVENNTIYDLTPNAVQVTAQGVGYGSAAGAITSLVVKGNTFVDTRAIALWNNGVLLASGTITQLDVRGNDYVNMLTADYSESSLTVTTRRGDYIGLPFTPAFSASGNPVVVGNGSVLGRYDFHDGQISVRAVLVMGGTTVIPAGNVGVTLPVSSTISGMVYMGNWRLTHGGLFYFGTSEIDGTAALATLQLNAGTYVTNATPVALASPDSIDVQIVYA